MGGWLNKRIEFHRKSFRVLWIPVMFLWGLFSNAATLRDNFLPLEWQQKLATLKLLPKWQWYVWVIGTLIIVIIALVEGSYRAAQSEKPKNVSELVSQGSKVVDVDLIPSKGQSERLFLAVTNNGIRQKVHAQCRIVNIRNDPNPQRLITFDLAWWNRLPRRIELANGESCNLFIAEARDMADKDGWITEWIAIKGAGGESIDSKFSRGSTELPEFDLEISVFGTASDEPYTAHFTVMPGTNCAMEMIRKVEEIWELDGQGGPRILLHWDYPPEAAYSGLGITHKILTIENSNKTEDAFDIQMEQISLGLTRQIAASMKRIHRLPGGHQVRADIVLSGKVPEGHQGEFEMVYFAAGPLRREFTRTTQTGTEAIGFPMVVTFKDYSGAKYRAHFEFTDNLDSWGPTQYVLFLRREKLVATRPV